MFIHTKRNTTMSSPRLLIVFVRDGAWAFVIIFGTSPLILPFLFLQYVVFPLLTRFLPFSGFVWIRTHI